MTRWLFHQSSSSLSLVSRLNSSRSSTSGGEEGLCSTEPPSLQHQSTVFFQCVETCIICQHSYLTIKWPMFLHANTPLEIQFMYLGQREIYCIFKTCYIISVLFEKKKCCLFHSKKYSPFSSCANLNIKAVIWRLRSGSYKRHIINICIVTTFSSL